MSAWTDQMQFCMAATSDYLEFGPNAGGGNQWGPRLQGGLVAPNGFPAAQIGISQGMIAAYNLAGIIALGPGSISGATRWGALDSAVSWSWVYAARGHSEPNAMIEMRRASGMVLTRSTNRWRLIFTGGRPSQYTGWNSTANLGAALSGEYAQPYFNGYNETLGSGNTSAYRPWGNIGIEAWPGPSSENPSLIPFYSVRNKPLIQDSDGYLFAVEMRVIPVDPSQPVNRSNVHFIAQLGFDFAGDTNGYFPWDYAHYGRNFQEGSNSRWFELDPSGQWQWVIVVVSGNLVPTNNVYRPPFAAAAGLGDYSGSWPYTDAGYGGRSWAQLTGADAPIDLIAYYSGGGVIPPDVPPPVPNDAYVHPGAATLPVWGQKVVSSYNDWGPKNRSLNVAPTWTPSADAITIAAGATATGTLVASGTPAPTYTKVSGPAWLTINSTTGALGGTVPAGAAVYSAVIRATNAAGATGSGGRADLALTITAVVSVTITTTTLPGGTADAPYYQTIGVTGTEPFAWSVVSGAASLTAAGLTASGGAVFGADPIAGTATFTLRATDNSGNYDEQAFTISIGAAGSAPTITTTSLATGAVGTAYSAYIAATGTAPFAYSIIAGALAAGLTATHVIDWDVALTGAALRAAIGDPTKYHAASQGWIIPGAAAARVTAAARSSVAWQQKADGTYEVAPHNLLPGSYSVLTANGWSKGPNITENGADGTLNGWPASKWTSTSAGNSYVNRAISVEVGCTYTVRFWCDSTGAGWVTMGTTNRTISYTKTLLSAGLYEWAVTFTAAATETTVTIHVGVIDAANGVAWRVSAPQVCVGSVACAHVPTHGAAVFGPAINWVSADGGAYEIESDEARTQLWTYSARMTTGGWGVGSNLTANGPDGTLAGFPAFRYTSAGAGNSFVTQDLSGITAGTIYTASFISDFGPSTLGSGARYLVTLPSNTQHTYTATLLATGVWEWSVTFTVPGGDNYIFGLVGNVDGGAATTWRVAQPQIVVGARKPGKSVSWGNATVTRAADTTLIPDTSPSFISGTAGTLLVRYRRNSIVPAATYPGIAEINWDDSNRVLVAAQPGDYADLNMQIRNGGTASVSTAHEGVSGLNRIAVSWSSTRADASQNGAAAASDTLVTLPSTASAGEIRIGRVDTPLGGGIRELYYRKVSVPGAANAVALSGGNAPSVGDRLLISGTPTAAQTQTLLVEAENGFGADDQLLALIINPAAPSGTTGGWSKWLTR